MAHEQVESSVDKMKLHHVGSFSSKFIVQLSSKTCFLEYWQRSDAATGGAARSLASFLPCLLACLCGAGLRCATTLKNGLPVGAQTDCSQRVLEIVEGKYEYGREENEVNLTHQRSSLCCVFFFVFGPLQFKVHRKFSALISELEKPKISLQISIFFV